MLILLSIFVTCSEVFLRFGILSARKGAGGGVGTCVVPGKVEPPELSFELS